MIEIRSGQSTNRNGLCPNAVDGDVSRPANQLKPFTGQESGVKNSETNGKHRHAEAFHVMTYSNNELTIVETLWNSRDGVTPFSIIARDKAVPLLHTRWDRDIYAPNLIPAIGDRVFVDLTIERAFAHCYYWVKEHWTESLPGVDGSSYSERYPDRTPQQVALLLAEEELTEHENPPPDIIVVTADWLRKLAASRKK